MSLFFPAVRVLALLAVCSSAAPAVTLVNLGFEAAGEYEANFRPIGTNNATVAQVASGGQNAVGILAVTGSSANAGGIYDATPGDSASKSTFTVSQSTGILVSADLRVLSDRSFGFYFMSPGNESAGYLALFNITSSAASNEQMRVATDVNPTTLSSGTLFHGNNSPVNAGMQSAAYYNVSVAYTINANGEPVFTMTANGVSSTYVAAGVTALTEVQIGWRANSTTSGSGSSHVAFDNFTISEIPEPSSAGLLALGMAAAFRRRRGDAR